MRLLAKKLAAMIWEASELKLLRRSFVELSWAAHTGQREIRVLESLKLKKSQDAHGTIQATSKISVFLFWESNNYNKKKNH